MKSKKNNIKLILIASAILFIVSCESGNSYLSPIRKDTTPEILVDALRKDSLFYAFKGYGVTPRAEREGIYLVSRDQDKGIYHWVKYHPIETKYLKYYNSYANSDSVIVTLKSADSLEILNKAHQLIRILKELDMRWAGWEFGRFNCSFNNSSRMTYVPNPNELDSVFYRSHKNLNWIDSNFVKND